MPSLPQHVGGKSAHNALAENVLELKKCNSALNQIKKKKKIVHFKRHPNSSEKAKKCVT